MALKVYIVVFVNFYRATIESLLTANIANLHNSCMALDRTALQQVTKTLITPQYISSTSTYFCLL